MNATGSRTRERFRPLPWKDGPVKLGATFIEDGYHSEKWQLIAPMTETPNFPFFSGERTVDELHGRPPYKTGGPFSSVKVENTVPKNGITGSLKLISHYPTTWWPYSGRYKYEGGVLAPDPWFASITGSNLADKLLSEELIPDIHSLGSQVWDRLKPRIEQGGLFVALAEAKDIPRMLKSTAWRFHEKWVLLGGVPRSKGMIPKHVAENFLNYQFGWVPFVKDVNDFLANIVNYNDRISRLVAENGQWIRRKATLVNSEGRKLLSSGEGSRLYPTSLTSGAFADFYEVDGTGHYVKPSWEIWEETETHAHATGSFRYYLPEFDGSSDKYFSMINTVRRTIDLFGARITPSNIYKAIPWTWLIDWCTSVGKSIQAVQDATLDQMAARYLYLTHHKVTTTKFKQLLPFNAESGGAKTFEFTQFVDVKQRKEASSPFGFDLDVSQLDPRQLAILASLGISRKGGHGRA
jgi:hypothetical protein